VSIQIKEISKQYGSFTALSGVSMTIEAGELVALLDRLDREKQRCFALLPALSRLIVG